MKNINQRALTIVELLIVIVMIGILAANTYVTVTTSPKILVI